MARGDVDVNGVRHGAGDGVAIDGELAVTVTGAGDEAEILLFDMVA